MKKFRTIVGGNSGESRMAPDMAWLGILGDATRAMLDSDARASLQPDPRLDVVEHAHGAALIDRDGREILDFDGGGAHPIGYGHPRVLAAVKEQIETLAASPAGFTNPPAIALAQRLAELAPGELDRLFLASSSATAIAAAIRYARSGTGRPRVVVTGNTMRRTGWPAVTTEHLPPLDLLAPSLGDGGFDRYADMIAAAIGPRGDCAAVVAEPFGWSTGIAPPPGFWAKVRAACDRAGTLLIFDETPSAIGRTGTTFYTEQTGIEPDLLMIGEGLGGGVVPVAAVIGSDEATHGVAVDLPEFNNPVAAAAALATLEVIAEDDLLERARGLGHGGLDRLTQIAARFPIFAGARGVGLTFALELAEPGAHGRAEQLRTACLLRGLNFSTGAGNVVLLTPPLTVSVRELERAFHVLAEAAADCAPEPQPEVAASAPAALLVS